MANASDKDHRADHDRRQILGLLVAIRVLSVRRTAGAPDGHDGSRGRDKTLIKLSKASE